MHNYTVDLLITNDIASSFRHKSDKHWE
jgi:hypothetical protein